MKRFNAAACLIVLLSGCHTAHQALAPMAEFAGKGEQLDEIPPVGLIRPVELGVAHGNTPEVITTSFIHAQGEDANPNSASIDDPERTQGEIEEPRRLLEPLKTQSSESILLEDVIDSVHRAFPLLKAAALEYEIAAGKQTAAWGAFDTKLKASSENGPTGFYQTYRNGVGFQRPLYDGGEVFGGYRIGRGDFQPWYLERQTNDGGEFKAGVRLPMMRNRVIDERRAELWRAEYDQQRVTPEVRTQMILFVRDGGVAYWEWIARGLQYDVGVRALELAQTRDGQLKRRVDEGDLDPPVWKDNQRSIATREAKLIERRRKLRQAGIKLSLYLRDASGQPVIPPDSAVASFPKPVDRSDEELARDIQVAIGQRPELEIVDNLIQRTNVDLQEAENDFLPNVDSLLVSSQDVGEPTSSKRDKSEFELEAGIFFDMPLQRRKAQGKATAASAKLRQLQVKRRFTEDKIRAEVQLAHAALRAAFSRVEKAQEARNLAEELAEIERRLLDLGREGLLSVVLREQFAIEAADAEIEALLEYVIARMDYAAALATDRPSADGDFDGR